MEKGELGEEGAGRRGSSRAYEGIVALRRCVGLHEPKPGEPYVLGELTIDYAERLVTLASRPLQLRAKHYRLLFQLSVNVGRVLIYDGLLRRIWGPKAERPAGAQHSSEAAPQQGRRGRKQPQLFFGEPRIGYRTAKGGLRRTVALTLG